MKLTPGWQFVTAVMTVTTEVTKLLAGNWLSINDVICKYFDPISFAVTLYVQNLGDFINVLQAAFTSTDPERVKNSTT